jgi:ssDNA-binding Zn-finger/Zn-ribbon topoisomerase 1
MSERVKVGKCPECNGKGKFVDAYADEYYGYDETCTFCDGTGKTEIITITKEEYDMLMDDLSERYDFLRELLAARVLDTEQRIKAFRLSAQGSTIECSKCPVCEGRSIIHETDNGGTPCPICDNGVSTDDEPPF